MRIVMQWVLAIIIVIESIIVAHVINEYKEKEKVFEERIENLEYNSAKNKESFRKSLMREKKLLAVFEGYVELYNLPVDRKNISGYKKEIDGMLEEFEEIE